MLHAQGQVTTDRLATFLRDVVGIEIFKCQVVRLLTAVWIVSLPRMRRRYKPGWCPHPKSRSTTSVPAMALTTFI